MGLTEYQQVEDRAFGNDTEAIAELMRIAVGSTDRARFVRRRAAEALRRMGIIVEVPR